MATDDDRPISTITASFTSIELDRTYSGLVEGSRETCSEYLLRDLREEYPTDFSNNGYALVVPDGPCLPAWTCKAFLSSDYRFDDEDDGSTLSVCWFIDELKDSMSEMIDDLMQQVAWIERARRYDMCDF